MVAADTPSPIDHDSFVPYYIQVKDQIRSQIDARVLEPGELLPSEAELCNIFGVSRTVVRQALQELEYEGLIYRRRGKGSFVAEPKVYEHLVQKLTGFHQDMVEQGHEVVNRVLRLERVPASAEVARFLELAPESQVIVVERLRLVDGKAINFSVSFVPFARCPQLLEADLTRQSLYAFLEQASGQRIMRGRRTIEAILPQQSIADLLETEVESPVFKITNTCYLADGTPIEHSRGYHRGDRSLFEVELLRVTDNEKSERTQDLTQSDSLPNSHTLIE
ncbi:MAG: GntR family transcriptional regulator [Caldilineaceae bacterium]|nr:GntR family transcriptional regulator [Caldilineaceae bacterium]